VTKPVILAVDDDREVLGAIERDLRKQYRSEYKVMAAVSPDEARDAARKLKSRGAPVALFLVDQRMPEMTGTQLFVELKKLFPDAKKVLLTAYADTEAAIAAINDVGLDHYLMKPWDPPEQKLYPVLDDLLGAWSASVRRPFEGVRIAGSKWSPQSYSAREFLARNQVPYQWVDIDQDAPTRELVVSVAGDVSRLPVVFFTDGSHLVAPSNLQLAEKAGLQTLARGTRQRRLCRLGRLEHPAHRAQRPWRAGGDELDDRELPWLSSRCDGGGSRTSGDCAGAPLRRGTARRPQRRRPSWRGSLPLRASIERQRGVVSRARAGDRT
jgi:CheY-like chemotaxis protein